MNTHRGIRSLARLGLLCLAATRLEAAPLLRSADVLVEMTSPVSCEVTLTVDVAGDPPVEHRLEAVEGSQVRLLELSGARARGDARAIGWTRALEVIPSAASYTLRYWTSRPPSAEYRCPLWIPGAATDGRSQSIRLRVRLPEGAAAAGTMPAFAWEGREGVTTLGHLPAFVHLPYSLPGEPAPWNVGRAMDVLTLLLLVAATVAFGVRQRGHRRGAGPHRSSHPAHEG